MRMRSFLFVPGDRPERFPKAAASGADVIILDLEDSVVPDRKPDARAAVADYLAGARSVPAFVRVNPESSGETHFDLAAIMPCKPDGIMLPKAEGARSIIRLHAMMGASTVPIFPIAAESPIGVMELGSLRTVADHLCAMTWGAEDLPAAMGAGGSRREDGSLLPPYETVRALTLFGAHAASIAAIETVYPRISDQEGLERVATAAAFDGFSGMLAIHPGQIEAINRAFTPTPEQVDHARAIIQAFKDNPGQGAIKLNGQMIDIPHLKMAHSIVSRAD